MQVKVGVVQDYPIFFDKEKTIKKVEKICSEHSESCDLLVFPESFIPGYPRGFSFGTVVGSRTIEGREQYLEYYKNSVDLDSSNLRRLEMAAAKFNLYLVIGVTEKQVKNGSLYCSMLYISPTHGLLGVHRKIKPTGQERIIWGESDGRDLVTFNTKIGKLGGLICWENYMPLARMAMYQQGVEIYIAPTADARESWIASMRHIALEGRCFVLGCNQYMKRSFYPKEYQRVLEDQAVDCRGGSVIISPLGEILAGPLFDKTDVLLANLDLDELIGSKLDFDVIGHYSRPDIFRLEVRNQPVIKKEIDENRKNLL
ncbi:MAG: carbon-nitrogen hydrolase family protein [Bacteroidota bacterium]